MVLRETEGYRFGKVVSEIEQTLASYPKDSLKEVTKIVKKYTSLDFRNEGGETLSDPVFYDSNIESSLEVLEKASKDGSRLSSLEESRYLAPLQTALLILRYKDRSLKDNSEDEDRVNNEQTRLADDITANLEEIARIRLEVACGFVRGLAILDKMGSPKEGDVLYLTIELLVRCKLMRDTKCDAWLCSELFNKGIARESLTEEEIDYFRQRYGSPVIEKVNSYRQAEMEQLHHTSLTDYIPLKRALTKWG